MELMTTYVTVFARTLTSYSYIIGAIMKKLFSRTSFYTNHCGQTIDRGYSGHCGSNVPKYPRTNHCGQPIGGGYRGHC